MTRSKPRQSDLIGDASSRGWDQVTSVVPCNLNYPTILWKRSPTQMVKIVWKHAVGCTGLNESSGSIILRI